MKRHYDLNKAIKTFYKTEPLKIDLAATVANKVFAARNKNHALPDKWLYVILSILAVCGLVYCLSLFKELPVLSIFIVVVAIGSYFVLSYKEYAVMSKRLLSSV